MKLIRTGILALIISIAASAGAGTLADVMKDIGSQFKDLLTQTLSSTSVDTSMATKAHALGLNIETAAAIFPDSIAKMPPADQPAAQVRYKDLMHQLSQLAVELEQAYTAGDRPRALSVLDKMNDLRKIGHTEFKI